MAKHIFALTIIEVLQKLRKSLKKKKKLKLASNFSRSQLVYLVHSFTVGLLWPNGPRIDISKQQFYCKMSTGQTNLGKASNNTINKSLHGILISWDEINCAITTASQETCSWLTSFGRRLIKFHIVKQSQNCSFHFVRQRPDKFVPWSSVNHYLHVIILAGFWN